LQRERVAALHQALQREETRAEALEISRGVLERVEVRPREGGGVKVEPVGEIAAMVASAQSATVAPGQQKAAPGGAASGPDVVRSVKVVAGTRNHRQLSLRCAV
ncbi:hypothetical protein WDZ92_28030, partial [Nostoc sp. NIES-2111]